MRRTVHRLACVARPFAGLLIAGWACSALAQGAGSWGNGYANDIFRFVLIALAVGLVVILLLIRVAFGNKTALSVLVALVVGLSYLYDHLYNQAKLSEEKRHTAYEQGVRALAEGCAMTSRSIEHQAKGDERIFIRLHDADSVPEFQRPYLLPSKTSIAEGVQVVTDVPSDGTNAIVVDIRYSRDVLPGSYPANEWYRTRYDLTARTLSDDKLVARTIDMEARNGFCLGDLERFLERSLNRSGVLSADKAGQTIPPRPALPDAYVRAEYLKTTSGVYLESRNFPTTFAETTALLGVNGCSTKKYSLSLTVFLCGEPPDGPFEVLFPSYVGPHPLSDSWLLIYRVPNGLTPLTSLRIEQRLADWRLARVWSAITLPPPGNVDGREHLQEFTMEGDTMIAAVYWGWKQDFKRSPHPFWYTERSVLRIPLPGVVR